MTFKHILEITFLNERKLIFFHTVILFHLFLSNIAQSAGAVEYTDCTSAEG